MIPFPEVIDNSMLNDLKTCDQKVFLHYMLHYASPERKVDLHAGGAFAAGLEATRRAFYIHGKSAEDAVAIGAGVCMERYGRDFLCPPESPKSFERTAGAIEFYFECFPLGSDPCTPVVFEQSGNRGIEFSAVEPLPINHPITGQPLLYSGRMDMLANFADGLFIEDDKTTKSLGESWVKQWDLEPQFSGYTWLCDRALGQRPKGILIRGISILKTKYDKAQAITYRSPRQIEEWMGTTLHYINHWINAWKEAHYQKVLGGACNIYGGCAYREVCKSENPTHWLQQQFVRRRWDPVTRTETLITEENSDV